MDPVDLKFCERSGRLIDGHGDLSLQPFDFVWISAPASLGCGNLVCRHCGATVRSAAGLKLVPTDDRGRVAGEIYSVSDWTSLVGTGLVLPDPRTRLYGCRCWAFTSDRGRWLDEDPAEEFLLALPPWSCAGHPRVDLPVTMDGVRVTEDTDFAPLFSEVVLGQAAVPRPGWVNASASTWMERLYHLIGHTPQARSLSLAISSLLDHEDVAIRAAAVGFFFHQLQAHGVERLLDLVWAHPERYLGVADPGRPKTDLGYLALVVIAATYPPDPSPNQIAMLRNLLTLESNACTNLIKTAARYDGSWLAEHAGEVVRHHPRQAGWLFTCLAEHDPANLDRAIEQMIATRAADPQEIRRAILRTVSGERQAELLKWLSSNVEPIE